MSPQVITGVPGPPISPSEILKVILDTELDRRIVPAGAVVGPASQAQQQAGVISVTDAGNTKIDPYVPMLWSRAQLRCLAHELTDVDKIGYHAFQVCHGRRRQTIIQPSTGISYLVHQVNVTAGPSTHFDSQMTWEGLMFVEVMIGTVPVA